MSKVFVKTSAVIITTLLLLVAAYLIFGQTKHDKTYRAQAQAGFLAKQIESFHADTGKFPASLEELTDISKSNDGLGAYSKHSSLTDPWGHKFFYRIKKSGNGFILFTLGKDGSLGGSGESQDIQIQYPGN